MVFARELVSGVNTIVGGDDAGTVFRIDKAATYADNGAAIAYRLRTRNTDFGFNQKKEITDRAVVRGKNLDGVTFSAIIDEDTTNIVSLGAPSWYRKLLQVFGIGKKIEFTSVSIEVQGTTTNARAVIREIELLAVDIALTMHFQARPPIPWWKRLPLVRRNRTNYLCGDIELLPLKDACVGLVWSNLALQWCNDMNHTFSEVRRVLQPGGLFMFSTFGPDTLKELRQAVEY